MKNRTAILFESKKILDQGWSKKHQATNNKNKSMMPEDINATKFSPLGAILRCRHILIQNNQWPEKTDLYDQCVTYLQKAFDVLVLKSMHIEYYNSKRTTKKQNILEIFDLAIELSEKQP